jgi:hypothetical protein
MIQIMLRFFILFFIVGNLFAEAPPVILEDGKDFYEISLNLDILEDPKRKLTIEDMNDPYWSNKFEKSLQDTHNFGFSKSSFWIRVRIKNGRKKNKLWYKVRKNKHPIFSILYY